MSGDSVVVVIQAVTDSSGPVTVAAEAHSVTNDFQFYNNFAAAQFFVQPSPQVLIAALEAAVIDLRLKGSIERTLLDPLQAAGTDFATPDLSSACNDMRIFIRRVDRKVGHGLDVDQAVALVTAARQIMAVMACPAIKTVVPLAQDDEDGVPLVPTLRTTSATGARPVAIRFSVPGRTPVHLEAFDIQGRRVRLLFDGTTGAGFHDLAWDGAGDGGAAPGPGLYFLRLWTPQGQAVTRVLMRP